MIDDTPFQPKGLSVGNRHSGCAETERMVAAANCKESGKKRLTAGKIVRG